MLPRSQTTALTLLLVASVWAACGDEVSLGPDATRTDAGADFLINPDTSTDLVEPPPLPWEPSGFPELPVPDDNPMTEARIALGRLLFHDPILSSDGAVACFTCHSPIWGMSDGLPVSVGIDGEGPNGTGRHGPNQTRRNSSTLWNVAYRPSLFWDGRATSLEAQVLMPLADTGEMNRDLDSLIADLEAIPEYVDLFATAFGTETAAVSVWHMQQSIAAFERTIITDNAPYDQYVAGDPGAMSDNEVAGMFLFAEVGCGGCHPEPLFETERYEASMLMPVDGDQGRIEVTNDAADLNRYRVPTLRNVRETTPYFHDGSISDLREAVEIEAGRPQLSRVLSDGEIDLILDFINKSLIDKHRAPAIAETVPSGLPVPLDDYQVNR